MELSRRRFLIGFGAVALRLLLAGCGFAPHEDRKLHHSAERDLNRHRSEFRNAERTLERGAALLDGCDQMLTEAT